MGLNLMSEGVRLGLDKEKARMGYTCAYFPLSGQFVGGSRCLPYFAKRAMGSNFLSKVVRCGAKQVNYQWALI